MTNLKSKSKVSQQNRWEGKYKKYGQHVFYLVFMWIILLG